MRLRWANTSRRLCDSRGLLEGPRWASGSSHVARGSVLAKDGVTGASAGDRKGVRIAVVSGAYLAPALLGRLCPAEVAFAIFSGDGIVTWS